MIGKTEKSGWQVGVRKTIQIPVSSLWNLITQPQILKIFTGDSKIVDDILNLDMLSESGIHYKITTFVPSSHIRMKWRFADWEKYSILQIRTIDAGESKSVLAVHQEKLKDQNTRLEMKEYWHQKIEYLLELIKII